MQDSNKLIELIEQTACSTNMLSPTDFSELDKLQETLDQINKNIDEISDGPDKLLEQAKSSTSEAAELLQKIVQNQGEDTNKSIESVSQAVSALQGFIGQIEQVSETTELEEAAATAAENTEAESQEPCIISEEDAELVLDFITESNEHIESSEAGLLELESKPDDKEVLNTIFRSFHTIKGMAGFLNLTEIGALAHSAENLLDLARKGELILADKNMDVIFESVDMLKKMIAGLKDAIETSEPVSIQEHLPQLLAKLKSSAEGQTLATVLDTPQGQENDKKLDEILETKKEVQTQKTIAAPVKERRGGQDRRREVADGSHYRRVPENGQIGSRPFA